MRRERGVLHPDLWLGSGQLFVWLFFHPAAWRAYVAHIDPELRPDFAFVDLAPHHWRNPALRRFLLIVGLVWPLLLAGLTGLLVIPLKLSPAYAAITIFANLGLYLSTLLLGGAVLGVAPAAAAGLVVGFLGGPIATLLAAVRNIPGTIVRGLLGGLVGGFVGYLAAGEEIGRGRLVGGVLAGILAGGLVVAAFALLGRLLVGEIDIYNRRYVYVYGGGLSLATAAVVTLRSGRRRSFFLALGVGLLLSALFPYAGPLDWAENLEALSPGSIAVRALAYALVHTAILVAMFALPSALGEAIGGVWAGAVAGALGSIAIFVTLSYIEGSGNRPLWPDLPLGLAVALLGLALCYWLPLLLHPIFLLLVTVGYRLEERRPAGAALRRWHPVFWSAESRLPFPALADYLVLVAGRDPERGLDALNEVALTAYRGSAQAAAVELVARQLADAADAAAIAAIHRRLPLAQLEGEAAAVPGRFVPVSRDVQAALQHGSLYYKRLGLHRQIERLQTLERELLLSDNRYATRFQPVAAGWRRRLEAHLDALARQAAESVEIDNPYIVGAPLGPGDELFTGREEIGRRIEQLLWDRRRPPLLLYGQRRVGKTSLLFNLGRLLPGAIVPLYVDGQAIAGASNYADLLYGMARQMARSAATRRDLPLPPLSRETLAASPFLNFLEWLDQVDEVLAAAGVNLALLALDEFEALDEVLDKGRFDEVDFMNLLRHLIQHRPRLKLLLAGAHTLDEFERWASYLINVQVIEIGYLTEAQARQLIEQPVADFALRYEPAATHHIYELTGGHPHLSQLLCYEIVALKNRQPAATGRPVSVAEVEAAVPAALKHGDFFFADIARNRVSPAGAALLYRLAQGPLPASTLAEEATTLRHLAQRQLVELRDGAYHFQVELVRRWFAARDNSGRSNSGR